MQATWISVSLLCRCCYNPISSINLAARMNTALVNLTGCMFLNYDCQQKPKSNINIFEPSNQRINDQQTSNCLCDIAIIYYLHYIEEV